MIKWAMLGIFILSLAVFWWLSWHFAHVHAAALPSRVGAPPADFPAPIQHVTFTTQDGIGLQGWYACPAGSHSAVVLLHPYGANRLSMLNRARLFCAQGYAVLLYDARGHGESEGDRISIGFRETAGLLGAIDYLLEQGITEIACVGWSQGGSTIMMAAPTLHHVRCVVLESAFDTMKRSIDRGFRKHVNLPGWLVGPLYTYYTERALGFRVEDFRPIDHVGELPCPVFVISGTQDADTWPSDTREIYEAAPEPKQLWMVDGAKHEDLYAYAPDAYKTNVLTFLKAFMPLPAGSPAGSAPLRLALPTK